MPGPLNKVTATYLHGSHSIIPCRHRRTRPRSCLQPGEDARVQRLAHTRIRELARFPHAMTKLNARDCTQLVVIAYWSGLVKPHPHG